MHWQTITTDRALSKPEGQLSQQLSMPDVCDLIIEDHLNFEASSNAKKRKHNGDWG
jgi:hypothetical protein